jgi:homocysteine S-methyltransferase
VLEEVLAAADGTPVSAMPNAGLPQFVEGRFLYIASPSTSVSSRRARVAMGVRLVGGCCGTTPAHIKAMRDRLQSALPAEKLAPGAEVRVLEAAPAPVEPPAEAAEPRSCASCARSSW